MFLKGGGCTRKLSDEQVEQIRLLLGVNMRELAKHFGVAWTTIQRIQSGRYRTNGREKELDIWRDKKARSFTRTIRRAQRKKDTGEKVGGSGKKRRKDWATRKTSEDFAKTIALRKANAKWVRSVEQFKEYWKKPNPMCHAKLNAMKTHCKRRHALAGDNVYVQVYKGRAMRRCLTCFAMTQKVRNAKKKQAKIRKAARNGNPMGSGILRGGRLQQQEACNGSASESVAA